MEMSFWRRHKCHRLRATEHFHTAMRFPRTQKPLSRTRNCHRVRNEGHRVRQKSIAIWIWSIADSNNSKGMRLKNERMKNVVERK